MLAVAAEKLGTSTRMTIGPFPGAALGLALGLALGDLSAPSSSAGGNIAESPAANGSIGGASVVRS
jgi:hypothetical protein